jgi:hypothetical protein
MAMAVVIPLSMLIYSNSRITEAKETLRAEIKASTAELLASNSRITEVKETLRAEMATQRAEIATQFAMVNNKLDHLLEVVSKHDQKLG